uniref:Vesicle-associated protein 1-4 n=1 Tax=Noccaea caerulescens TaxID=107243 RepID=A0A1J3I9V3_NOCCA
MTNFSPSWKHDQVFISFRGKELRGKLVSFLKEELKRSGIDYFMDECETRGSPITKLFERIRESGVALIIFSNKYPESSWCLDELVEINKQMEKKRIVPFPVFYKVKADSVKRQIGYFRNSLLKTEDHVRKNVDRRSYKSILETEARIWGWRQALVSVGGIMGFSYKHTSEPAFLGDIVVKLKELLDTISSQRNDFLVIEKPLMHPQEAVTMLKQALNLKQLDLEDLVAKPSNQINGAVSLSTDHLVFLDLISLKNPVLAQRLIEPGQAGKMFLVLLGSLKDCNEGFVFKPRLLPKIPQLFPASNLLVSFQESQYQSYSVPGEVTSVVANRSQTAESTDNLRNFRGDDSLTCFSFLCNIMKRCSMMIRPPLHRVFISFGEKELDKTLVSSLKKEFISNRISVDVKDEIKESKVAIVVFSIKYPESQQCLDELVQIKKLMDAGEIDPFPIFYTLKAEPVKDLKGCFLNRLLKIEDEVRKKVNRENEKSILDTEARICGWREALLSIASRPGLTYQHSSDPVFVTDVVTKVKELFAVRERPKDSISYISPDLVVENPPMHRLETEAAITRVESFDDDLFYSLTSFFQALNLDISDLEGFTELPSGLVSLSLNGHANLVFLNMSSTENLVRFQRSDSFEFLRESFALNPSGVSRFEEPSHVLALESNSSSQQWADDRFMVSSQDHQISNNSNLAANML